jgi:hypothetical protein
MLNSQHRNNKKNNAPQAAMLIIFFVEPCRKTANASPSGVQSTNLFLCCLLPVGQQQSLRQHGGEAFIYFFE